MPALDEILALALDEAGDGCVRLQIRVTPKAAKATLDGFEAGADARFRLKLRVTAVPDKGAANAAVIALLAKTLRCPKSAIRIIRGQQAREKQIAIDAERATIETALKAALKA